MSKFVNLAKREVEQLDLPNGEWVLVKKRLTNRERREINMAGLKISGKPGSKESMNLDVDLLQLDSARLRVYLTGWSFKDDDDNPVQFNKENLDLLEDVDYEQIVAALDEWVESKNSSPPSEGGASQSTTADSE